MMGVSSRKRNDMKKIISLGLMLFLVCSISAFAQSLEGGWLRKTGEVKMLEFYYGYVHMHTFESRFASISYREEENFIVWMDWEGYEVRVSFRISGNTLTLSGGGNNYNARRIVGVYTREG